MGDYSLHGLFPGDRGITQTINSMRQAVLFSVQRWAVRRRAEEIVASCPERNELCEAKSIFKWALAHYRYLKDPKDLELVKSPEVVNEEIDRNGFFQGDCDDFSAYVAALLYAIGYKVRFVTISVPGKGDSFRHVYVKVYLPKLDTWLPLEGTARRQPAGFEPPNGGRIKEHDI